ncbi:MAG: CotH kinase family protein, partial [SAR202 cluster bacterium]|nr:CotH kinase family protein [SAR202 cluster bacterium]
MLEIRSKIYAGPKKLKLEFNSYLNKDPKLYINIGFKEFKRLEYTRERNLINRAASYSSDDWVPAKIKFDEEEYKVKIRLKGVYLDHWIDAYKWSFRIKIKEGRTLFGSSELSLQDPSTRNYLLEWVFMKMLSDANLIHHRTQLSEVILNGEKYGIYMIQDQYSKYLIEYNKRREGPIIGFNKELYVSARQRDGDSDMASLYDSFYKAPLDAVTVTAKNDPKMINLAEKGIQMLESFRQGKIEAHQVFDYKALAKATAIRVLLGSTELDWRDIKFYVNPISLKLEPVMREVHAYSDPTELTNWSTGHDLDQYQSLIFSDPIFFEEYLKELYTISRESFLKRFYEKHGKKLIELEAKINNFQDYKFPYEKIETRAKVIREKMNPTEAVNSYITNINKESVSLKISAVQPFASEIGCVTYEDNPILCPQNNFIVYGKLNNSPPKYKLVNMKWVATDFDIKKKIKE